MVDALFGTFRTVMDRHEIESPSHLMDVVRSVQSVISTTVAPTIYNFDEALSHITAALPDKIWTSENFWHLFKAHDGVRLQVARYIRCDMYSNSAVFKNRSQASAAAIDTANNSFLILPASLLRIFYSPLSSVLVECYRQQSYGCAARSVSCSECNKHTSQVFAAHH